jgi:hypothetical protein
MIAAISVIIPRFGIRRFRRSGDICYFGARRGRGLPARRHFCRAREGSEILDDQVHYPSDVASLAIPANG